MFSKPPPINDPLESAKIGAEEAASKVPSFNEQFPPAITPSEEASSDAEEEKSTTGKRGKYRERQKIAPPPPPMKDEDGKVMRVVHPIRISWKGQFIKLRVGDVVKESSYGSGCHDLMTEAGVKLEPV